MCHRRDMSTVLALVALYVSAAYAHPIHQKCGLCARTESGWVRGVQREAADGSMYVSFRGVPYAKQPLGPLRFKELEAAEPWPYLLDAKTEGPICPQTDKVYGSLMKPQNMSEACIHANIHVPIEALPLVQFNVSTELEPPYETSQLHSRYTLSQDSDLLNQIPKVPATRRLLPIFVFIHGGGFASGSGDADVHGPEYLVSQGMIVITFNYRLNVFGFLSLDTAEIPGNAGLRDMVTLLRWVNRNAENFGGDRNNVTLAGQSAGAVAAHILTMSDAAEGLFHRAILMSGTANSEFISTSPAYAQFISNQLLTILGITSTDIREIQQQLIDMPAEKLIQANAALINVMGFTTFMPMVETPFDGVTTVLADDPDVLVEEGKGKIIPLLIGFTNNECETFRAGMETFDIAGKIKANPALMLPIKIAFSAPPQLVPELVKRVGSEYYKNGINLDNFIKFCSEGYYEYPALKLVEERNKTRGAPTYLYQFSYEGENSVIKRGLGLNFTGAGHIEDLTYMFKVNSIEGDRPPKKDYDYFMKLRITNIVSNFIKCSQPICGNLKMFWPDTSDNFQYQDLENPLVYKWSQLTGNQKRVLHFFDSLSSKTLKK